MRIAITHGHDGPEAAEYAADLTRGLLDAGHEVHVFGPAPARTTEVDPRARIRRVPDSWRSIDFMRAWSFDRWLTNHVRPRDWDVVHGLSWSSVQDVTSDAGAVAPERDEGVDDRGRTLLERQRRAIAARRFQREPGSRVLAPSRAAAEALCRRHGLQEGRVRVSPLGADTRRFTPELRAQWGAAYRERIAAAADAFIVLCLTNSYRDADVPLCIDVCRRLKAQGLPGGRSLRFGVVGSEKKAIEAEMSGLCKAQGVYDQFKFYGPQHLIERWIALADVIVLPATADAPFSRAAYQAMACGVPTIISPRVGAADVIESGREGWILDDPADPEQLARHLLQLATDEEARRRMGQAARETAERHSLDRHVRDVLAVYGEVMSAKGLVVPL